MCGGTINSKQNDTKFMYRIVRELTNSWSISSIPIKSKYGRTLTTEDEQSNRWMKHFEAVLKQPDPTNLIDFEQETPMTLLHARPPVRPPARPPVRPPSGAARGGTGPWSPHTFGECFFSPTNLCCYVILV